MAGFSEKTLMMANEFSAHTLCMIDNYKDSVEKFSKNKKRMVAFQIVIREKYEEAEKFVNDNIGEKHKQSWTVFGTEEDVIKELNYLENIGVTDVMIRCNNNDKKQNLVHNFVKRYNSKEMV
jgi:hypothetical protein